MDNPLVKAMLIVLAVIGGLAIIAALAMSFGCCGMMGSGMMGGGMTGGMMGGGMLTMLLVIAVVVAVVVGVIVFIFRKTSGPR